MSDGLRKIPVKNYIILFFVIIVTIFLLCYFRMWVDVYKESKINIPIMDKYMSLINYNELSDYVIENPDTLVYVSILEDEKIRTFEKEFKNKYKNDLVDNDILYMNITDDISDIKKDSKYILNDLSIVDVPCLLYFKDSELKSIYSIELNDYDIERFLIYVNNIDLDN